MESLYRLINIGLGKSEMVCLVGAGGKTSAMFRLAYELSSKGKRVLVTTTTAIYHPEKNQYDKVLISDKEALNLFDNIRSGSITVLGKSLSAEGKLKGVNPAFLDKVFREGIFDYILIEADGSKGRSIKAPAEHEPVIPPCTTKVLGFIGLDCIKKKVCQESVHRPEIFCRILGCCERDIIDTDIIIKLVTHKEGLFKTVPDNAERYFVLNKAEGESKKIAAYDIAQKLLNKGCKTEGVIISSIKDLSFRNAVKSVSGIILAAGLSKRMGVDKLLLPVGGVPLIERVISAASKSKLGEIVLVCGSDAIASIGRRYGAKIVKNVSPMLGQSHSVKLGVEGSRSSADGLMFLVGDQPLINESIINDMIESFTPGLFSVAVPLYNGKRGNPVIFDSAHSEMLLGLRGDSGGRVLLEKLKGNITTVEFTDEKSGFDIDTREEYERVLRLEDENE
jgi:probable selenium-dependent hydroxylase accessory protein YqeC